MDTKPTIEDLKNALVTESAQEPTSVQPADTVEEPTVVEPSTPSEEPLKAELERLKGKKTPAEKARDSLYFNAQEAKKHGIDPTKDERLKEIFGIKEVEPVEEEDKPVTKKELAEMLTQIKQSTAVKTAEELAESIPGEAERELVKFHLQNTIKSTGNADEDLKLARALANSVRNAQILEEQTRRPEVKSHSSATSAGTGSPEPEIVYTAEERAFLATGMVTKEDILLARQGKPIPPKV